MSFPHKARLLLFGQGLLYLAVGCLFVQGGRVLATYPGIFRAAAAPYIAPHACEMLECEHGYLSGTNGELYCSKYPPRQVLDARTTSSAQQTRLLLGAVFGGGGLLFAAVTLACGLLWLSGFWIPEKPARWYAVVCRAAPVIVIGLWVMACMFKVL